MKLKSTWIASCSFFIPIVGCAVSNDDSSRGDGNIQEDAITEATSPAQFGACPSDIAANDPNVKCATIQVPIDYSKPFGEKLSIMISKAAATDPAHRKGAFLINRGGPGIGALGSASARSKALPEVHAQYDFIGFDPRGVGHSTPIHCDANFWQLPMPDPTAPEYRDVNWKLYTGYAKSCADNAGKYVQHMDIETQVRDLDAIRAALGESKINYLGVGWGTYLGAMYGTTFPNRVARMILSGNMNPDGIYYGHFRSTVPASEVDLHGWFAWIAKYDSVFHLGDTHDKVEASYRGVLASVTEKPQSTVGPFELTDLMFFAAYTKDRWAYVASALSDFVVRGDASKLIEAVGVPDEGVNAAFTGTICSNGPFSHDRNWWDRDRAELAKSAPYLGWYYTWFLTPCASWAFPQKVPPAITGGRLPPILMFNSIGDPSMPYEGALRMHDTLPSSRLVSIKDVTTNGFGWPDFGDSPAATKIGIDYLVNDIVPAEDVTVEGTPEPNPTAARAMTMRPLAHDRPSFGALPH